MRPELLAGYIDANILAVGAGFDLIMSDQYEALQDDFQPEKLREALVAYVEVLDAARAEHQNHIPFESKDPAAIARASGRCLNVD